MTKMFSITEFRDRCRPLARFAVVMAFLASFSLAAQGAVNCTGACITGFDKCWGYCSDKNKTAVSRIACQSRCMDYWYSGKNPQSMSVGPVDPKQGYVPGKKPPVPIGN